MSSIKGLIQNGHYEWSSVSYGRAIGIGVPLDLELEAAMMS